MRWRFNKPNSIPNASNGQYAYLSNHPLPPNSRCGLHTSCRKNPYPPSTHSCFYFTFQIYNSYIIRWCIINNYGWHTPNSPILLTILQSSYL
jgi:hypothetical protein